jgi:multisubunit Na+/H+ antiporter MnhE subunit
MAWPRVVTAWLAVWAASFALWLLLTSTVDRSELIAGAGAAAIAATVFEVVREHGAPRARPRWEWLKPAPVIPLLVARDTVVVFAELVRQLRGGRRRPGRLQVVELPDLGDEAERNAHHLFVTIGVSLSPNTYVIGFEPERDQMLVHQLVPKRPSSFDELFSL